MSAIKLQCAAFTKDGKGPQCSRNALEGEVYCKQHFQMFGSGTQILSVKTSRSTKAVQAEEKILESRASKSKIEVYRFRAETPVDIEDWFKVLKSKGLKSKIKKFKETQVEDLPDVDVEFESELELELLRKTMMLVVDGHVMVESLDYSDRYNGDRYYEGETHLNKEAIKELNAEIADVKALLKK